MNGASFSVYAPGRDFDTGNEVQGICGNFDGQASNDYRCHGCVATSLSQLFDGQQAKRDLFNWYPSSILQNSPNTPHVEECTYLPPAFKPPILSNPNPEDITDLIKGGVDDGSTGGNGTIRIDIDLNQPLPEYEEMDVDQARDICTDRITNSAVVRACKQVLPSFAIGDYIDSCTFDLAATSDQNYITAAVSSIQTDCAKQVAAGNTTSWERDNDGNPLPPEELRNNLCPSIADPTTGKPKVCSDHGTCENLVCKCTGNYVGADCSVDKTQPPVVSTVTFAFCDVRTGRGCGTPSVQAGKYINVQGVNIYNSSNLACRFGDSTRTTAVYLSSTEVLCALPTVNLRDFEPVTMNVALTTDGTTFGASSGTFTWYDAVCNVCNRTVGCIPNPESCTIDDACYLRTQPRLDNICLQCLPEISTSSWSYAYKDYTECGPKFPGSALSTQIVGSAEANQVIYSLNAANALVSSDPNYKITYSLYNSDEAFAINQNVC